MDYCELLVGRLGRGGESLVAEVSFEVVVEGFGRKTAANHRKKSSSRWVQLYSSAKDGVCKRSSQEITR